MPISSNIRNLALVSTLTVCGCANVSAVPVNVDGTKITGKEMQEGIRYYLPKPYLLVTELPEEPQPQGSGQSASGGAPAGGGGGDKSGSGSQDSSSATSPSTATPAASSGDTSFSAATASYAMKLIYLPDIAHPMALTSQAGLFGNVSVGPTLQDGWMLTAVSESTNSGVSDTLTAVGSILSAVSGGGAAKTGASAGTSGSNKAGGAAPIPTIAQLQSKYGLTSDQASKIHQLLAEQAAAAAPAPPQQNTANWGPGVLRPGLYEFRFASDGTFAGFFPAALFCGNGVVSTLGTSPAANGLVTSPVGCTAMTRP